MNSKIWKTLFMTLLMLGLASAFGACGDDSDDDSGADSDSDSDSDADSDSDGDTDDGCVAGGNWYDSETQLCWQNPPDESDMDWNTADAYCDDLSAGGFDDWRLPKIHELFSLTRGCVHGEIADATAVNECDIADPDCLYYSCASDCWGCSSGQGPDDGSDSCYWPSELDGTCDRYWSSSRYDGDNTAAWMVKFNSAEVAGINKVGMGTWVRCVRP